MEFSIMTTDDLSFKAREREKIMKCAEEMNRFWREVEARFSDKLSETPDKLDIIDVHFIADNCIDLTILRSNPDSNISQLEHCCFTTENKLY